MLELYSFGKKKTIPPVKAKRIRLDEFSFFDLSFKLCPPFMWLVLRVLCPEEFFFLFFLCLSVFFSLSS